MAARFELRRISERNLEAANAYRAIAGLLERDGVPTARGGKRWEPAAVRSAEVTRRRELEAQAA